MPVNLRLTTLIHIGRLALMCLFACGAETRALSPEAFLSDYCERCHNDERLSGNWSLSMIELGDIDAGKQLHEWENILRVVERGEMPPPSRRRKQPSADEKRDFAAWLTGSLDARAAAHPDPGRATLRRLNRNEYSNAVRDLLGISMDVSEMLPADDTGYGFDNIADVLSISPTLMDRYFAVAETLSHTAVGTAPPQPYVTNYVLPKDGSILNQGVPSYDWRMSDDLPIDSRGGAAFQYYAPYDGEYILSGYLNANTNNEIDRLEENRVETKVFLNAGTHSLGMAFRKDLNLDERVQVLRNSTDVVPLPTEDPSQLTLDFIVDGARVASTSVPSYHWSDRYAQHNFLRDVLQIDVDGPYSVSGQSQTASRDKIFICKPNFLPGSGRRCAKKIIQSLAGKAYKGKLTKNQSSRLLKLFEHSSQTASFEESIATVIQAILVSPRFIFVQEVAPDKSSDQLYSISDTDFATRLALFLWSSLPDEELLALAKQKRLREPEILQDQISRMLNDERSEALTENFSGQWLYLRNLEHHRADVYEYPEFDAPLREAMREESELFFASILSENQSVLSFLQSDYSYLNERLAKHYGLDGVTGPAFRKVQFPDDAKRGGLLGQASILTVTSYANHTSVVRRGKWILDNLLAAPPPPPPPDIPALQRKQGGKALTAREQLALHSEDPSCASCHVKMDPLGLALENFDALGSFRTKDEGLLIDASTKMPDGTPFEGLSGLQDVLLERKEQFVSAFTQRLMIYGLGRGIEAYDYPSVRDIVRQAAQDDYKIQSIIQGIVQSTAFNYRRPTQHATHTAHRE